MSECVDVYETKPYTLDNYNGILKTRPPCMYSHKCPCPCHSCGGCVFKISFTLILNLLFTSRIESCNVGKFHNKRLLQKPAVWTPFAVQSSVLWRVIYIFVGGLHPFVWCSPHTQLHQMTANSFYYYLINHTFYFSVWILDLEMYKFILYNYPSATLTRS